MDKLLYINKILERKRILNKLSNIEVKECDYNNNNPTHIYYITHQNHIDYVNDINDNFANQPIKYNHIIYNDTFIVQDFLTQTVEKCLGENILIVFDISQIAYFYSDSIENINNALEKIAQNTDKKRLLNITILSLTNNTRNTIYTVYKNNAELFKKVINVFVFDELIKQHRIDFFNTAIISKKFNRNNYYYLNLNLEDTIKVHIYSENIKYNIPQFLPIDFINKKTIVYRFIKHFELNEKITNQWWFKWYFAIPPCASGRLTQSSGTCWLNSIFNTLFLVPEIAVLIKNKYNDLSDKKKTEIEQIREFKNFTNNQKIHEPYYTLENLIYFLVKKLLIDKIRAQVSDKDFMLEVAAKIKSQTQFLDENYYFIPEIINMSKKYSNKCFKLEKKETITIRKQCVPGEQSLESTKPGFKKCILPWSTPLISQCYSNLHQSLRSYGEGYFPSKAIGSIMEYLLKNQDYYIIDLSTASFNNKVTKLNLETNVPDFAQKYLTEWEDYANNIEHLNMFKFDTNIINFVLDKKIDQINCPKIIVIIKDIYFKKAQLEIQIDNKVYKLRAAPIYIKTSLSLAHAVSGIICYGIPYIYDSNNILLQAKWFDREFVDYNIQFQNIMGITDDSLITYELTYLIYIQE